MDIDFLYDCNIRIEAFQRLYYLVGLCYKIRYLRMQILSAQVVS
jgi:hypothetical protein